MQLNNINISERNNRPVVLSKVGLQAMFLSDGEYQDPYQIHAVSIFSNRVNLYPSSVLDSTTQLIDTANVSGSILMNFANSNALTTHQSFDASNYNGDVATTSGIFKIGTGKYIVVLDGTINSSGVIYFDGLDQVIANTASATGDYIDVWTITWVEGSEPQTVINEFNLRKGGFTVLTEPLMLKAKSRLVNNKVTLGSKVDLKVATDIHVENRTIDQSVKNLLRENVITSGSLEIQKLNEASNLPARVTVSSFSETSSLTDITADNVMIFTWDTNQLTSHPQLANFGSIRGVYSIKAKFTMFNETIVTDPMYLTLS